MEKLLRPYDREHMKLAMMKHEETFREQVYELHRLYRIQKALMKNSNSRSSSSSIHGEGLHLEKSNYIYSHNSNPLPSSKMSVDFERLAGVYNNVESEGSVRVNTEILDESEIELTLGPTSYKNRRSKKADTALTSDSSPTFSSSSSRSSSHNGSQCGTHQLSPVQMPYTNKASENGGKGETSDGVEEGLIRERVLKQPAWFFQVLSLNSS
ncbi:hypothetical protein BT93_G1283 [Corymbia citriodora subsp. variegata]|nr:hypothetical protein BT93_G1283 [Corymbia citriodora subsp. variegata]KAF8020807.1 hypothetical protein BT93_G1283 [Corymbia citriodora subsp. variegata]KAF8020808.1 hypothetical protein BT93_G1283 [Corymbia citriodora subsp. variegata]